MRDPPSIELKRLVCDGLNNTGDLLCHHWATFFQFAGSIVLLGLGLGWMCGAIRRASGLRERLSKISKKNSVPKEGTGKCMPGVSVVMPVKGVKEHSLNNWKTQVDSEYPGDLEFVFVADNLSDPACSQLGILKNEMQHVNVRLEVSGQTTTCSQKIHNLHYGLTRTSVNSKYVLFLDDDVALQQKTITELVRILEDNPETFMVTGYPFDIPLEGANILAYCVLAYHLPLMIAFSVFKQTNFVWGGCMLLRRASLLNGDPHGIVNSWLDGGYSDDLIMGAKCVEHGLKIAAPLSAIFPQRLAKKVSWRSFWNYLRRQLYVCDTYATDHNKTINHSLLLVHCVASTVYVVSSLLVLLRVVLWQIDLVSMFTRRVFSGEDATVDWRKAIMSHGCDESTLATTVFVVTWTFAAASLVLIKRAILRQFLHMSPSVKIVHFDAVHYAKVWIGLLIFNAVIPICTLYTMLSSSVVWSNIRYYKKNGKVVKIEHVHSS